MKNIIVTVGKVFSGLTKLLSGVLIIALIMPVVFFAWRAGQPMEMPQYDGRTYYELMMERKVAYDTLAEKYQASHPNKEVK